MLDLRQFQFLSHNPLLFVSFFFSLYSAQQFWKSLYRISRFNFRCIKGVTFLRVNERNSDSYKGRDDLKALIATGVHSNLLMHAFRFISTFSVGSSSAKRQSNCLSKYERGNGGKKVIYF